MTSLDINYNRFFRRAFHRDPIGDEAHRFVRCLPVLEEKPHQRVLRLRFGLDGSNPKSRARVAEIMGLDVELIRPIENYAIIDLMDEFKMRRPSPEDGLNRPVVGKWTVIEGEKWAIYNTFEDAVEYFRSRIHGHLDRNYDNGLPRYAEPYFNPIYGPSDEAIVAEYRLKKLMSSLLTTSPGESGRVSLSSLALSHNPLTFHVEDDSYSKTVCPLSIEICERKLEIQARIEREERDRVMYVRANAFNFRRPDIEYYFDAHFVDEKSHEDVDFNIRLVKGNVVEVNTYLGKASKQKANENIDQLRNLALLGSSGAGKTVYLCSTLRDIMNLHSPEEVRFAVYSDKPCEYEGLKDSPYLLRPMVTYANPEGLEEIFRELENRRYGNTKVIVVIDDVSTPFFKVPRFEERMISLLRDGPRKGIHFLLAFQNTGETYRKLIDAVDTKMVYAICEPGPFSPEYWPSSLDKKPGNAVIMGSNGEVRESLQQMTDDPLYLR